MADMTVRDLRIWLSRQSPELPIELAVWLSPTQVELVSDLVVETIERNGRWVVQVHGRMYVEEDEP
jgi:hypothetical protein